MAYLFGTLELGKLPSTIYSHSCTKNFNLISVHSYIVSAKSQQVDDKNIQVLAIKILAFSIRLGELVAIVLSRINPSSK